MTKTQICDVVVRNVFEKDGACATVGYFSLWPELLHSIDDRQFKGLYELSSDGRCNNAIE